MTIAVIKTGGKQYVVREGQTLHIEKITKDPGAEVQFDALLVSRDGTEPQVGRPSAGTVSGRVLSQGLGDKVSVIKFKRKVRYKRSHGHRQPETVVKIEKI